MRLLLRLEDEQKSCAIWEVIYCQLPYTSRGHGFGFLVADFLPTGVGNGRYKCHIRNRAKYTLISIQL